MRVWDDALTERDKQVFARAGFGARQGFGKNPAVVIIDVNYNFTGEKPEPILKSIETSRNSCGEEGWVAVRHLRRLLEVARPKRVPIFYTTNIDRFSLVETGRRATKNARTGEDVDDTHRRRNAIVREIEPRPGEIVIAKDKASAFYGTPLAGYLIELGVDQVLVTGTSTSGCVRATTVDAWQLNFNVAVIEECVFDRGQTSHKMALFDMNAKYADVVPLAEVERYLSGLPDRG